MGTVVFIPLPTAKCYVPLEVIVSEGDTHVMELKTSPKDRYSHSQRFLSERTSEFNLKVRKK